MNQPTTDQSAASRPAPDATRLLPDYLPARMLNEFTYCPRLFYYEWVEAVFAENRETVEGALRHQKIDDKQDEFVDADSLEEDERIHARSVMLSSDTHGLIAKIDVIEGSGRQMVPVDYKRGRPTKDDEGNLAAWDADRAQLAAAALILRDNGYECDEGVVYYVATKQRVRFSFDEALLDKTVADVAEARRSAACGKIPPPLVDSPKCPRCSLVGICLPDETNFFQQQPVDDASAVAAGEQDGSKPEIRRLVPARDDLRPLYLNTQGLHVGKSGSVLKVKENKKVVQEVRINEISQLNLFGNIQLTTQAVQALCQAEKPVAYFSFGGWFYGITQGLGIKNIFLRREQFRHADDPTFCLQLARTLVAGKIRNQRTMLMRNHIEPPRQALVQMKCMADDAEQAQALNELLGIEGNAAREYFQNLSGMIKVESEVNGDGGNSEDGKSENGAFFSFHFEKRNRRPPRDAVNALLSLAYSVLAKDLTIVCHSIGFDPYLGFFHQPRFGRASLALDLMEPFRSLIADSTVLSAINTRMVTSKHFVAAGRSVALTAAGRKAFFRAYEQRMDALVTHPLFGYRVNYRRVLEIQARLLARLLTGELESYPVFLTR